MPVLPLQRVQPGQVSLGRQASAADFGAAEGAAQAERGQLYGQVGQVAAQVADANDHIRQAANQAKLARVAAQYGADLDRAALDLESDPDLDSHEGKIQKTSQDLLERYRKELPTEMHGALEARVFPDQAHARLSVVSFARTKRIDNSRADLEEMARLTTDREAQEADPVRRAQIRGQRDGTFQQAMLSGIIDQGQYDKLVHGADKAVGDADRTRALLANPAAVYHSLQDLNSPLRSGLTEAEVAQWQSRAAEKHEQDLAERRAQANFDRSQQDHAKALADDAAARSADDLLAKGDIPGLQSFLSANRETLTPEHRRFYLERIAAGGGFQNDKTDPAAYIDLSQRSARGEDIHDATDSALRTGKLTREDRDRLLKSADDKRFGDARQTLQMALHVGEAVQDPAARGKAAKALSDYDQWVIEHPKADRAEASKYATQLAQDAALVDLGTLNELRPTFAVPAAGNKQFIDVQATAQALEAAKQSGQIDEFVYRQQKDRIIRWKRIQEAAGVK